jgi:(p)ppGpp synthase/HD superfamily hydrolase
MTEEKILEYIKKKHEGQMRAENVPTWHHLARVAHVLLVVLEKHKEGTTEERQAIIRAGYGHDLLEDTKSTEEELIEFFGEDGALIIHGATNEWGDDDVRPYVEKMSREPESVRLVKLADLYDNISNVTYCLSFVGTEWTTSYFLRVVTPMYEMVTVSPFITYQKAADELKFMVQNAFSLLHDEFARHKDLKNIK